MAVPPTAQGERNDRTRVGLGLTSEVFAWGKGRVLKLPFPWRPAGKIAREFAITRAVHAAGVPVPEPFEIIEVDQRHGIVFEHVVGVSLLRQVEQKPWRLLAAARQLAELHAVVHSHSAPDDLPTQYEQIERWIEGSVDHSPEEKEVARRHLSRLPASNRICHGDFHPANILLTERGPVIIDWSAGTRGHPLADVARTSVLFESASLPRETPVHIRLLMTVARRLLHTTYLKRYFELRPGTMEELEQWRVPQRMAASAWREERKALGAGQADLFA